MIDKRNLGKDGPPVGRLGYGAMVLEGYYGTSDDEQAVGTIRRALDAGLSMIDTADAYGNGHNETLVARAIEGRRDLSPPPHLDEHREEILAMLGSRAGGSK